MIFPLEVSAGSGRHELYCRISPSLGLLLKIMDRQLLFNKVIAGRDARYFGPRLIINCSIFDVR
jgi:hypothetical protein